MKVIGDTTFQRLSGYQALDETRCTLAIKKMLEPTPQVQFDVHQCLEFR